MRILTAAVWLAATTWSAEASSILVIDDKGEVRGPSVVTLDDGRELAAAPSVQTVGPSIAAAEPDVDEETAATAESVPPLPTVIRGGIEGDAFARAVTSDGAGPAESGQTEEAPGPAVAKPPATRQPAQAAVDPTTTAAAPPKPRALPAPEPARAPEIKPE